MTSRRIFIKQIGLGTLGIGLLTSLPGKASAEMPGNGSLPRSTPEEQGVSSEGIHAFLEEVAKSKIGFHSIMIVRHGYVIAEGWWAPYAPALKHTLYSLSKSFTSTAVGFAVAEGKLTVDDAVISFFPNDVPSTVDAQLAAMKIKHLLTMSSGHGQDTLPLMRNTVDKSWVKSFLEQPLEFEPGTHFLYNTGATYMLSAILQKITGETVQHYLRPRLFDPLGIEGEDWETNREGINVGGYGLRVKTEDLAKFGLLYLQKGKWNGKQLLPAKWVDDATNKEVNSNPSNPTQNNSDSDWSQGYGYQFWRCKPGGFRGDGAFGQFSIVNPDKDTVIAATSESFDLQSSMRTMWSTLLPALKENKLPANALIQNQVKDKLKNLVLPFPTGNPTSSITAKVSGKKIILESNDFNIKSLTLKFTPLTCTMILNDGQAEHETIFGINAWLEGKNDNAYLPFPLPGRANVPTKIASSSTWSDNKTLVLTMRLTETAHGDQFTFTFDGNSITIKFLNSISMGNPGNPEKRADVNGEMA